MRMDAKCRRLPGFALCALMAALSAVAQPPRRAAKITITAMPADEPSEALARTAIRGTVIGAPKGSRVIVYALGDVWYAQPWAAQPYTEIRGGTWSARTHGGYGYAAFLVKPPKPGGNWFKPPARTETLPRIGGDIIAMARATPRR